LLLWGQLIKRQRPKRRVVRAKGITGMPVLGVKGNVKGKQSAAVAVSPPKWRG